MKLTKRANTFSGHGQGKGGQKLRKRVIDCDVKNATIAQHTTEEIADPANGNKRDQSKGNHRQREQLFNNAPQTRDEDQAHNEPNID